MKNITKTGIIPINSIGLILKNYLRWFKVFAVFQLIPTIIIVATAFLTQKEKLKPIFEAMSNVAMASMSKNPVAIQSSVSSFMETFTPLFSDPAFYFFSFLSVILGVIIGACLLVGIKHSYYKEISIKAIFKEGISKIWSMLWTLITMIFMVVLIIIVNILLIICGTFIAKYIGGWVVIPGILLSLILLSSITLYFPIHFFSNNNPFSSLWYSFTTFWKNFGFWFCLGIISVVISFVIYFCLSLIAFLILKHYLSMQTVFLVTMVTNFIMPAINALVPYITFSYIIFFPIFVAYPELLDGENDINLLPQEESPILSEESLTKEPQQNTPFNNEGFKIESLSDGPDNNNSGEQK